MEPSSDNSHYLIVQRVKNKKYANKVEIPANIKEIQKLIECLVGHVSLYLYNKNNSFQDLTKEFGKNEDIDFSKLKKINKVKYTRIQSIDANENIGEFFLSNLYVYTEEHIPKIFTYRGTICKKRTLFGISSYEYLNYTTKQEYTRKINAGTDYERYIAQKYIESGYTVIFNGIDKGKLDGGIDLIAIKEDKTILIQCKNWQDTGYEEIYDRDIRAFFGDCFKYILDHSLINKRVGMHYIVANEESINKSTKEYLKRNTNLKYKCIPFEIENTIL